LEGLSRGLPKPQQLLENITQRLDDWSERLQLALPKMLERKAQQLEVVAAALRPQALIARIALCAQRLEHMSSLLESLNYKRVLDRGFALVKDISGKLVTTAKQAQKEKSLTLVFKDGEAPVKQ
jgi:exodeoxyribonuclease VII large subunit